MFAVTDEVRRLLEDVAGLKDEQIDVLAHAALEDELTNWNREQFAALPGFGRATAFGAFTIIQQFKVPEAREIGRRIELPEAAPYLVEKDGRDYDPHNPTQFYTVPETGEMYRWDGKRSATHPSGMRRPVIQMPHVVVNGIQIPDPEKVADVIRDARRKDADWFHHGYGCWVTCVGKPLSNVDPEKRAQVVRAIESVRDIGYVTA